MSLLRILTGAALAAGLAGCTPNPVTAPANWDGTSPVATIATSDSKETPDLAYPFSDHLPWNPNGAAVQTAEGGLQYIVLKEGPAGGKSPAATDFVTVNYDGRRTNGEQFDSSFARGEPAQFRLNQVIPGWTQGLQLMSEGDEFLFFIPNALAYGPQDRGPIIKAGDDLVFHVALLEVAEPVTADQAAWSKYLPWKPDLSEVVKTASGLQYIVLASGDPAGLPPVGGQYVAVHYEGRLAATGELFDSSFDRGAPEVFPSNQLIAGWTQSLSLMRPGDRWMIYVPSALAYGEAGTPGGPIPPNADLQFEVQLLDVQR